MPKVSVIMGVYNCNDYRGLLLSVQSIINQSFKDWELIICNDGSTNGKTKNFLKKISLLDDRIRIIEYANNRGLPGALNYCLKYASGEFIARQDEGYDQSFPHRLEMQVNFLVKHNEYEFVGSNCEVFDDASTIGVLRCPKIVSKESFLWNSPFAHPTVVFRRTALVNVKGYRQALETKRCEDYDLFMRMYSVGMRGYNLQEILYRYKVTIDSKKKYRSMKDRLCEAVVRYKGFKKMGIILKGAPYVIKPILVGLLPSSIFAKIKRNQLINSKRQIENGLNPT